MLRLPIREGDTPRTTSPGIPHKQRTQNAPHELQERMWGRMQELEHVRPGTSPISGPLTRSLHLAPDHANGPDIAFAPDGFRSEFAHIHDSSDGSLHMTLSIEDAQHVVEQGWGEWHPTVLMGMFPPQNVMVYGPRDEGEVDTIMQIVTASYRHARGEVPGAE